jgi:hypothetical protein
VLGKLLTLQQLQVVVVVEGIAVAAETVKSAAAFR